jgi:hypothetical protein
MRSHFLPTQGVAATCAIAGALSMLPAHCAAQSFIAADYATNSTYASGWSAGQNGGYGFGPWSFDGTNPSPPGQYQGISSSSAIGTSWTLLTHSTNSGISNVGRAISEPGGLQPGQTLEVLVQNPRGYVFFRGVDICCLNGTNNNPGGINTAALRSQIFCYFVKPPYWSLIDGDGSTAVTALNVNVTGPAGMKFDLTLITTNSYSVTLTPLSNPSAAYTQMGTFATTNVPINWVNFRCYWGESSGVEDPFDNFEISSMTISGPTLNIQKTGTDVLLSWMGALTNFALVSSTNIGPAAVWTPVAQQPSIVNGQNVVTNSVLDATHQFYRLQSQQTQ